MYISVAWNKLTLAFIVLTTGYDLRSRGGIKKSLVGQKCNCCVCKDVWLSQAEKRMDMCLRGYLLCSVCVLLCTMLNNNKAKCPHRDPFSKPKRHNHLIQIRKVQYTEEQRSRQIMSEDETISLGFPTFLYSPAQHITESKQRQCRALSFYSFYACVILHTICLFNTHMHTHIHVCFARLTKDQSKHKVNRALCSGTYIFSWERGQEEHSQWHCIKGPLSKHIHTLT